MIFSACPPVYHLPGTWTKCKEAIIPHGHVNPQYGFVIFIVLVLLFVVGYGLYLTFGEGGKELRDPIDEHAKMHELGIAHRQQRHRQQKRRQQRQIQRRQRHRRERHRWQRHR